MSDSTISASSGGNKLRITGMASGLDVDATVKKMIAAEQLKVDKAKQDEQEIQWKQETYQDIIKGIKDLQSSFFDTASSDKNMLSSSNFAGFDVTGGSSSVANITAGPGAQVGNYTVKVTSIASGSGVNNTLDGKFLSTKLTDYGLSDKIVLKLNVNGSTSDITINLDNSATGKNGNATLGDLVNAINDQGGESVKASFSELTGKFSLTTSATGNSTDLIIRSDTTAGLSNVLGVGSDSNTDGKFDADITAAAGKNAVIEITPPGETVGIPVTNQSTNVFTIDGINYNLSGAGTSTITVGANNDKVYDKIKSFIDKYNTIVDDIQTKLTEKKDYTYKPLTDAQKESMSDSEIATWETKAKKGVLRNDDNLQNMLTSLRSAFTTAVDGTSFNVTKYGSNSIGLDFGSDAQKPAHLDIADSAKFKNAIATKGDQILKFFTNISTDTTIETDGKTKGYHESGIFSRLKDILEDNVGKTNVSFNSAILTKYANKQDNYSMYGSPGDNTLPDQIYQQQILITKLTDALSDKQEAYYLKFSKLETAMNNLNSQQSWLTQQLSS